MLRRARLVVALGVIVAVLLSGCGSGVSDTDQARQRATVSAEEQLQGFTKVTLRIRAADGSVQEHCVWMADSELEQQRGLQGIADPSIGGAGAMVFVFDDVVSTEFWMKDTVLPLSIAWVDDAGAVVGTTDMDPCRQGISCRTYASPRPYRLAVEMAQGRLQDWGIGPGATVERTTAC